MFKVVKGVCEDFFFRPCEDEEISDHEQKPDEHDQPDREEEESGRGSRNKKRKPQRDWDEDMDHDEDNHDDEKHTFDPSQFHELVKQFFSLKRQVSMNRDVDLLVHAGTKEDIDRLENNQNMNKVVISGLTIPALWTEGKDWKDRVSMIKESVTELFKFVDPSNKYELGFVKHLNQQLKAARQIIEVTLETEKHGRGIRKALAEKIKVWKTTSFPECMNGVSISPSLTIATRVRIAILKAIAKIIRSELKGHDSWVIQHAARPVIKIEITLEDNRKVENSYGFAQAIAFMIKELPHRKISDQDLFDAYTIAGTRFGPELSHHFVLLNYNTALSMAKERARKGSKKTQKPKDSTGPKSTSGQQAKKKGGPQGMAQKPSGSQDPKSVGNKTGQGTSQSAKN